MIHTISHGHFDLKQNQSKGGLIPMSDFTRSLLYSGFVLAAGLMAIIAIQNNMDAHRASSYSMIEPAAGQQASIFKSSPAATNAQTEMTANAADAKQNVPAPVTDSSDVEAAANRAANEALKTLATQLQDIMKGAGTGALQNIEPAAGEPSNQQPAETAQ